MPGRLAIFDDSSFKEDASEFIKNDMIKNLFPRYNIPPTLPIPALLNNGNYLYVHFGYLPSWALDRRSMNINARSESIFEKKTFRDSYKARRCLIPINGFFEWEKEDKKKIPYFVSSNKSDYLALAGVWDEWYDKELMQTIVTVALITCDANDKLGKIHPRMPVVLEKKDWNSWLNFLNLTEVNTLFRIYPSESMKLFEVSSQVNKVSFDKKEAVEEVKEKGQLSFF